jgi:hypothetical protein
MDMAGVTREEAVLYLLSLQDQIDLIGRQSNYIAFFTNSVNDK